MRDYRSKTKLAGPPEQARRLPRTPGESSRYPARLRTLAQFTMVAQLWELSRQSIERPDVAGTSVRAGGLPTLSVHAAHMPSHYGKEGDPLRGHLLARAELVLSLSRIQSTPKRSSRHRLGMEPPHRCGRP